MNIIFLSDNKGKLCSIGLCRPYQYFVLLLAVLFFSGGIGYLGYHYGQAPDHSLVVSDWKESIHKQQLELESLKQESDANVDAFSSRLGLLQAHVNRLDALGQKLIHMAKIDTGEFDFNQTPAIGGGPEPIAEKNFDTNEFNNAINKLSADLSDRESQLVVLEDLLMNRKLLKQVLPSGRPIKSGWLSSYYGMRTHPITGRREMHKGIDFASKMGGPVVAVAKGVVTFAGSRYGYGKVVDINHGKGYTTRYGHNSNLLVSVGDTVDKGFQIAEIGSSGRSTGPHVHFEVLKNGRHVNPVKFIRASN